MKVSYYCRCSSLASVALVLGLILALGHVGESGGPAAKQNTDTGLQVGFYNARCRNKTLDIQAFIEAEVEKRFRIVPTILAAFLRLQFHDCFVRGCDASILIKGTTTEINAGANEGIRELDFIDALKAKVEAKCPGVVSCADIIAIATKVVLKLGGGPDYKVQTGRRDGTQSDVTDVNLPGPSLNVPESFEFFDAKNFTLEEMVTLLGCHTVGIAHCRFIKPRLFNDSSEYDPNMDENLRQNLIKICPKDSTSDNEAFLDQSVEIPHVESFDTSYFSQLLNQRGVLPIDQALERNSTTNVTVNGFISDPTSFNTKLALVMVKLQAVEVLTGTKGNIRKVCSKFNLISLLT